MSKKQKTIICSYCGAENAESQTVCSKCGRIIKAKEKAPFDYRPLIALMVVLVLIAAIAGTMMFVMNHWMEYRDAFYYWYLNNEETAFVMIFALMIIITTIIVWKFSNAEKFSSIYWISYIIMFVLGLIVESFHCLMTGEPFSSMFDILCSILLLSLAPGVLVKIIRFVSN